MGGEFGRVGHRILRAYTSPAMLRGNLTTGSGPTSRPPSRGCENGALMDDFGIFLQGLLGVVAFSTLMCEYGIYPGVEPRQPRFGQGVVGFLDTSKQAIGMLFIHFANVYLSELTEVDPCSLYLINFLLDASLGMLLIYIGVRLVSSVVEWQRWESLRFGEYGDPLQCSAWVGQCSLYILIMMFEKVMIILVLLIPQWKKLALLNPIENPQLELAIVMLIVPFFVNALMFWVVDNFLMKKGKTKAKLEEKVGADDSRNGSKVRYRRAHSHEESESEPPDQTVKCYSIVYSKGMTICFLISHSFGPSSLVSGDEMGCTITAVTPRHSGEEGLARALRTQGIISRNKLLHYNKTAQRLD
ncbi:STIMA regulator, partial [Polypterus senegalus]